MNLVTFSELNVNKTHSNPFQGLRNRFIVVKPCIRPAAWYLYFCF